MPHISIFWVHATSQALFDQDYRALAALAKIPGHDDPKRDICQLVKAWLQHPDSGEWLLILDNADDEGDFRSDALPDGVKGTMIVTTRNRRIAERYVGMDSVEKNGMNVDDTRTLFEQHYPQNKEDAELVLQLLQALGHLPLAIVQAAGYLKLSSTISLQRYLKLFETQKEKLLSRSKSSKTHGRLSNQETILSTFAITFEHVQNQSPLAASLLKFIGCLNRQWISQELLACSVKKMNGNYDELDLDDAINTLVDYSLIRQKNDNHHYEVHSLIHSSIAANMSASELESTVNHVAEVLKTILPWKGHDLHMRMVDMLPSCSRHVIT